MKLKTQNEIIKKWNKSKPKLAILCLTYNHEKYIRQALDSILMQETTYPYKIFVFDDASTDSNPKIILEYKKKYPDLFELYLGKENLYKTPNLLKKKIYSFFFKQIAGYNYFAILEGDDFWTYPQKIDVQLDFLEKNQKISCCAHTHYVKNELDNTYKVSHNIKQDIYTAQNFSKTGYFPQTATCIYNFSLIKNNLFEFKPCSDTAILSIAFNIGDFKIFPYCMSVYRIHSKGEWSKLSKIEKQNGIVKSLLDRNKFLEYKYSTNFLLAIAKHNLILNKEVYKKITNLDNKLEEKDLQIKKIQKELIQFQNKNILKKILTRIKHLLKKLNYKKL